MLALALILTAAAGPQGPEADGLRPENSATPELRAAIHAADAEHFRLMWKDCEPASAQDRFVDPPGEFFHDRNGFRAYAAPLVAAQKRRCDAQAKSGERTRRELVEPSFAVYPIPGFGALSTGEHRFFSQKPGGPEMLVATGRFAIIWKQDGPDWKVFRSISYDHRSRPRAR